MKNIACLCIGLLMLMGCSTKFITTSNGKLDMSQIPSVFSEKKDYKIRSFVTGRGVVDEGNAASVNAQEMLDKIIPMCIISDAIMVSSVVQGTENTVIVRKLYKENHITGIRIVLVHELKKGHGQTGELHPGVVPLYTTYMEWNCEDSGCQLVRENINEDDAQNISVACTGKVIEARERKRTISACESWGWK
ncbi:MAG: hypothetical protein ACXWMI_01745 [Syntrophales bacterium]